MPAILPVAAVAGLVVVSVTLLRRTLATQVIQEAAQGVSAATADSWRALGGVRLPAAAGPLLDRLAAHLDFQLEVTSGTRSASAQASAMAAKIQRGENLYDLYSQDDLVSEVYQVIGSTTDPDIEAMAIVIDDQVQRGRYISRHLRGDALDLRTKSLSSAQLAQLGQVLDALGVSWLRESDHIHIEGLA